MGQGLLMSEDKGIHFAWAAGTGVLTFMDLVAQIARTVLDKKNGQGAAGI